MLDVQEDLILVLPSTGTAESGLSLPWGRGVFGKLNSNPPLLAGEQQAEGLPV